MTGTMQPQQDEAATGDDRSQVDPGLPINGSAATNRSSSISDSIDEDQVRIKFADWGFKIDRLFEVAYRFYKRNESKAFHPSFDERNKMIALIMQAKYGNHDGGKAPDVGALDLVGKRRQQEWSLLKGMSKTEAMSKFICALDDLCPIFKAHAEAVKISSDMESQPSDVRLLNKSEMSTQMHNIYSSLCKQTYNQFKGYAEKQYPNDAVQQKYLVTSLQDQYYQQYISQMHPELKCNLPSSSQTSNNSGNIISSLPSPAISEKSNYNNESQATDQSADSSIISDNQLTLVSPQPHLDLPPLPEVRDPNPQSTIKEEETNAETIYPSDIYCADNNVQADISSEELNSELATADSGKIEEGIERSIEKIQSTSNLPKFKPSDQPSTGQMRTLRNPDPATIGVFESFPEPKPIKNISQKSTPIDQINPNLPAPTMKAQLEQTDPQCATTQEEEPVKSFVPQPTNQGDMFAAADTETKIPPADATHSSATVLDMESQGHNLTDGLHEEKSVELWGSVSSDDDQAIDEQVVAYEEPEPATIWTKRELYEFKESLGGDKQGGIYEVKESTLNVIQVPTYPDGKYIYWEFATDDFDIGFGLEFVYEKNLAQPLALHIYEDEDSDEEDPDEMPTPTHKSMDLEHNGATSDKLADRRRILAEKRRRAANTITIVPTYRRDSHQEVFVGRHKYPGRGYYLLRFDNTYSLLRSKTLYFRICYFM